MIGFEADAKALSKFKDFYFHHTVAYIGKEDPFVKGQMKPITWGKINPGNFPKIKMKAEDNKSTIDKRIGDAYVFENDSLHYFIQDYLGDEMNSARRLVVLHARTKALVYEEFFFEEDGVELARLNYSKESYNSIYQWTGNLFKAKPPVVLGFTSISFGCPYISFLDKNEKSIYISCDNRH
ncbi:hypothetical protein H7U12_04820 [Rufibacter sp. H-1]|uniref:Uncharacterized protein n=1 Tax=Rufibacter sediminis TaxID=2762756 RepID=A0ABR6VPC2_9BACT|nr:hypothetical protein [Rufibacter sediminis]MBC3538991.1 hypothetical protein [Rufibacter sediminis]